MFLNFLYFASKFSIFHFHFFIFFLLRISGWDFLLCIYPEQNNPGIKCVTLPMIGDWNEMSFEFPSNTDHSGFL